MKKTLTKYNYYIMKKKLLLLLIAGASQHLQAQQIIERDPEIAGMVKEVSPDSLKSYISTLVAFVTRSTLSTQTDAHRGIGAAR